MGYAVPWFLDSSAFFFSSPDGGQSLAVTDEHTSGAEGLLISGSMYKSLLVPNDAS